MRFRLGFVSGFAAGYYLGAKAGRERYNQIRANLDKLQRSDAFQSVSEKAKEVVGEGVEVAKAKVQEVVQRGDSDESPTQSSNGALAGTPGPGTAYAPDA